MSRFRTLEPALMVAPAVLVLLIFLGYPLLAVLRVSVAAGPDATGFTLANFATFFSDDFYLNVLLTTVTTSAGAAAITLVVGYPFALYMAFGEDRFRRYLVIVILSPLLISGVVRSYALVFMFSPGNPVDRLLPNGWSFDLLYTRAGVMIGLAHTLLPFMVLSLVSGLSAVDRRVLVAARSLGASSWVLLWRILVPLSLPGVIAGCLIVFNLAITSFAIPLLLGGSSYKMLVSLIYQQVLLLFNWPFGFAIGLILLTASALTLLIAARFGSRAHAGSAA